jgi:hypothetical protein
MEEGPGGAVDDLEAGRNLLAMSEADLWVGYFALGGNGTRSDVHGWLVGEATVSVQDRNLLSQVLDDAFIDRGLDDPTRYREG